MEAKQEFVVIQEGGSSQERYVHRFATDVEAGAFRISAAAAAYRTSAPVPVPAGFLDMPGVQEAIDGLLRASADVAYPKDDGADESPAVQSPRG